MVILRDSGWRNILRKVPSGAVLYLPGLPEGFERGVIKDFSGQANHGTIDGAGWVRLPSGLWGPDYDGTDDFTNCGTSATLAPATGTIAIWVKSDEIIADKYFVGMGTAVDDSMYFGQTGGTGENVNFAIKKATVWAGATTIANTDTTNYHLWVGLFDGVNLTLSKDTVRSTPVASAFGLNHLSGQPFRVGWWDYGTSHYYFNGQEPIVLMLSGVVWTQAQEDNFYRQTKHLFEV